MISLVVPTLDTLRQWLDDLGMNFFECDTCQALHLPHMQNFDGVYDAKINLVDNTVLFSAMAEVRPSALLPLAADLSAINASSLTVKAFLDMQDDNLPKLVVCQSLSVMQGVTYEQFEWFVRQSEEQISMVILEAGAHQLLFNAEEDAQKTSAVDHFLHCSLPIIRQSLPARLLFTFFYAAVNLYLKNYSPPFWPFRFIT
ncbi:YbjN sensory transduction regulator [Salmonella enterica subsp. enterica serovar Typhi]|nr:YbjN sensory transduction regulator [Salmonella enterica subsp. enterica serovar Typhi]